VRQVYHYHCKGKNIVKTHPNVALAALALLPVLAAKPAPAQQTLTPALLANDIAITELAARRPLSAQERAQVVAINQAQFRREPAWSLKVLRREVTDVKSVRRMDPVRLADWRKAHVAGTYFYVEPYLSPYFHAPPHLTPEEKKTFLAIYTSRNPIVYADPVSKTIICQRDLDAWVAASKTMAQKSGVPVAGDLRAALTSYARSSEFGGPDRIAAANMERNWAAYQLGWAHEPQSDQRGEIKDMKKAISAGLPQSPLPPLGNTHSVAIAALTVGEYVYNDYPYCLSPSFAARKGSMQATNPVYAPVPLHPPLPTFAAIDAAYAEMVAESRTCAAWTRCAWPTGARRMLPALTSTSAPASRRTRPKRWSPILRSMSRIVQNAATARMGWKAARRRNSPTSGICVQGFSGVMCGLSVGLDTNAAVNILALGQQSLAAVVA